MSVNGKIFTIVQDTNHPVTKEVLITKAQIESGLKHKTITKYAYILHDRDRYTEDDEEKNSSHKANTEKAPHYHIVIQCSGTISTSMVANWFCVPEFLVERKKDRGAFNDCVQYLTHENCPLKAPYADSEVVANYDFREAFTKIEESKAKKGCGLELRDRIRLDVYHGNMTLNEVSKEYPKFYIEDMERLKKLRWEYLNKFAPIPKARINFYVCGAAGISKGFFSRALARSLFPEIECDEEIFFEVANCGFNGYDGQPVIIWNDKSASELLRMLGSRKNVFDVFDTKPNSGLQNIKYGAVKLINKINIINNSESFDKFRDDLMDAFQTMQGKKVYAEDVNQAYRRFPIIIPVFADAYDVLINKGILDGTREFDEYVAFRHVQGACRNLYVSLCERRNELRKYELQMLKPATEASGKVEAALVSNNVTCDDFSHYGELRGSIEVISFNKDKKVAPISPKDYGAGIIENELTCGDFGLSNSDEENSFQNEKSALKCTADTEELPF